MSQEIAKFKLDPDNAVLVVIDIQERLVPVMPQKIYHHVRNTVAMLMKSAQLLSIPIVTTEQYPRGIGHTVPELATLGTQKKVEKVSFGCCGEPNFLSAIMETGKRQVLITGMEAHVCVYQTVLGLLDENYHVHVVRDAVCSRNKTDYLVGLTNAAQAGAVVTSAETALFQLLKESTHTHFKAISGLVKERT